MDVRSIEAVAVGLYESLDMDYISQGPEFIQYLVKELDDYGVPVIKPAGGLGAHLNCSEILPEMPHNQYPAAAVAAALYIAAASEAWSAEQCRNSANPTVRNVMPSLSCYASPCRAECSPQPGEILRRPRKMGVGQP